MAFRVYDSPLLALVQKLVQERPANLTQTRLAQECDCSRAWLCSFSNGNMPSVTVKRLEVIYTRLTGKQLVEHVYKHTT